MDPVFVPVLYVHLLAPSPLPDCAFVCLLPYASLSQERAVDKWCAEVGALAFNASNYTVGPSAVNYVTGYQFCHDAGMQLASVTSLEEWNKVNAMCPSDATCMLGLKVWGTESSTDGWIYSAVARSWTWEDESLFHIPVTCRDSDVGLAAATSNTHSTCSPAVCSISITLGSTTVRGDTYCPVTCGKLSVGISGLSTPPITCTAPSAGSTICTDDHDGVVSFAFANSATWGMATKSLAVTGCGDFARQCLTVPWVPLYCPWTCGTCLAVSNDLACYEDDAYDASSVSSDGHVISISYTRSEGACKDQCMSESNCVVFSFRKSDKKCWTRSSSQGIASYSADWMRGLKSCFQGHSSDVIAPGFEAASTWSDDQLLSQLTMAFEATAQTSTTFTDSINHIEMGVLETSTMLGVKAWDLEAMTSSLQVSSDPNSVAYVPKYYTHAYWVHWGHITGRHENGITSGCPNWGDDRVLVTQYSGCPTADYMENTLPGVCSGGTDGNGQCGGDGECNTADIDNCGDYDVYETTQKYRTLFRTNNKICTLVMGIDNEIGTYSDGQFRTSGHTITTDESWSDSGWQFVVATGNEDTTTTTFWEGSMSTAPSQVGTVDRVCTDDSNRIFKIGNAYSGPGQLARAYQWNRILSSDEILKVWYRTKDLRQSSSFSG